LCAVFISCATALAQAPDEWKISKSRHFIVYYKDAPEDFIEQVINKSEDYYGIITDTMGFTRFDFWLWENRAKIYVYNTLTDYSAATGQPKWSAGVAVPKEKTISTFVDSRGFFDGVLAHELGHIIFRELVGFDNYAVPLWLEEGVASYQENLRAATADLLIREAADKGELIPLNRLSQVNYRKMPDSPEIQLFYAEAASIVGFMINSFGSEKFVEFCQNLRDKKDFNEAIRYVL